MRMRQSMAQLEREFEEEAVLDRQRREQLRRTAIKRTRVRRRAKIERGQQLRFLLLHGLDRAHGRRRDRA